MMSVLEYAIDINKSVDEVLAMCEKLDINVNLEDDMLDNEMVIILDNEFARLDSDSEEDNQNHYDQEEDTIDSYYEELEEEKDLHVEVIRHKKKDPKKKENIDNFKNLKKEMYKHKGKLKSNKNELEDNIVLYKEGMSVNDLAISLGVSVSDVIKKLFALGIMVTINDKIDFDAALVVVSDYDKTLKKEFHGKTIAVLISKYNDKFILEYVSDKELFFNYL